MTAFQYLLCTLSARLFCAAHPLTYYFHRMSVCDNYTQQ